jgi:hypothetical protein
MGTTDHHETQAGQLCRQALSLISHRKPDRHGYGLAQQAPSRELGIPGYFLVSICFPTQENDTF